MKHLKQRAIKIPTPERLRNAALFYLSRYAASEASLRRVLLNRLSRAARAHPAFKADHETQAKLRAAIEEIIEAHKKTGAVNDAAIAEMKVASLRRSGRSEKFIRQKLNRRGLHKAIVSKALDEHDGRGNEGDNEAAETKAALAYAKRRRLGPFRAPDRKADRKKDDSAKKDFAALARAGFSIDIIRKILNFVPDEGLD
jgi:regulatory protein